MTCLTCQVNTCVANKNGGCCLPSIKVEGAAASSPTETICGSFRDKNGTDNSLGSCATVNSQQDVICTAKGCCHNEDGSCKAETICIDCSCGCGRTTQCASFQL
ncbi:MAG: DUF1540 domain-containing protein [Angelakisella sp.]